MRNKIIISNYGNLLSIVIIWILLRIIIDFLYHHLSIISTKMNIKWSNKGIKIINECIFVKWN